MCTLDFWHGNFRIVLFINNQLKGLALPMTKNLEENKIEKIFRFFSLRHPRLPVSFHKKCQPFRSSRLAGYRLNMYECLVLLYRRLIRKFSILSVQYLENIKLFLFQTYLAVFRIRIRSDPYHLVGSVSFGRIRIRIRKR